MANEFVARNGLIAQANSQITGSLIVSNGITADLTGTASYASNANLLDGVDSTQLVSTSSFNAYTASVNNNSGSFVTYTNFNANTSSINNFSASILSYTSSINSATSSFVLNSQTSSFVQNSQTSSFVQNSQTGAFVQNSQTGAFATFTALNDYTSSTNNFSASILSYTASQNNLNGTYATTGSNIFKGTQVLSGLDPSGPSPSLLRLSGSNGQNAIQFYSGSAQLGNIVNIDDRLIISNPHSVAKGITLLTNITGGIELNTEEVFIHNVLRVSGSTLIGTDTLTPTANEKLLIDAENLNSYNLITARSNVNNYSQFNIKNQSSGSNASSDVVATNDIGTESTYYVDLGINSSQFADQIGGPNDAYLYTTGSNLLISNLTNGKDISLSTTGNGKINATGSVIVTGSLSLNGSNVVLTNQTSSFVQNSQTSSFVQNSQTSSMSVLSASYAATASFAGNFTVANTLTAQTLVVQTVTSSVIYSSGSNTFGNSLANTQVLTGSVIVTGSLSVNGSNAVLTNQTSSFVQNSQTSSFVQNSQTGAFATFTALNAYTSSINSYTSSLNSATSSFVLNSQTSSLATFTALNAYTSSINSYTSSLNSATSSFVRNSQTSSMTVLSASFASTASKISILNDVDTRILTANGDGTISAEGNLQFDGNTLKVLYQAGDEGGEILLNKPVTNTSISGSGVLIDVYQNKLRFFEQGAPNRGAYIDITAAASSVGTNLLAGGGGGSTDTGSLATTGSNLFRGNQIISGSLTVTSSIYQGFFASNETQLTGYGVVVQGANARLRVGPNYTTGGDRDYIDLIPGSTNSRITTNNENLSLENRESNGNISLITSGSGNVNVTGSLIVIGSLISLNGSNVVLTNQTGSFATFTALNAYTSSINTFTSSVNSFITGINSYTSSNDTTNTTQNNRIAGLESYTSSLNSATSSFVRNSQTSSMSVLTAASASNITNAITNAADNRVLTANGGGTINGEANLTFNGSNLILAPGTNGVTTGLYVNGGDITAARASTTGVVYFGTSGNAYLYFDGSSYIFGTGTGYVINDSSFRAPIFYDSNNTAYYVDPASTSNLVGLTVANTISGNISGNAGTVTGLTIANSGNPTAIDSTTQNYIGYTNSVSILGQTDGGLYDAAYSSAWQHQIYGDFRTGQIAIRGKNNGTWQSFRTVLDSSNYTSFTYTFDSLTSKASGTGTYTTSGDFRAPIFYDSNDTAYYLNPASDSNLSTVYAANFRATNAFYLGSNNYYFNNTDNGWYSNVKVQSAADMRAPIFYDLDNTAYYVNPASTSNLLGLTVANTISGNISGNAGTATTSTYVSSPDGDRIPNNKLPNGSPPRSVQYDFAGASYITGATGNYAGVMTYRPWDGTSASTGDSSYQLAFCNFSGVNASGLPGLALRNGINSGWNSTWYQVLHSGNYTSYTYTFDSLTSKASGTGTYTTSGDFRAPIFYDSDNTAYFINPNGSSNLLDVTINALGVGTAAPGTAGLIRATNDVVAYYSSDRRLKDNIKLIENPLEKISKIGGYEFDWNDKQEVYEGHDIGIIAQEIEEILPEIVTTRDSGYKAVKYEKIVPLLIEGIKEQQQQINELKELVNKLINK